MTRLDAALPPEWMLVRKDESVWAALEADPAFVEGMRRAEEDMAAGRVTRYELVPTDEIARLRGAAQHLLDALDDPLSAAYPRSIAIATLRAALEAVTTPERRSLGGEAGNRPPPPPPPDKG